MYPLQFLFFFLIFFYFKCNILLLQTSLKFLVLISSEITTVVPGDNAAPGTQGKNICP